MKVNQKLMGFAAGTKILMADGSEKEIEKIKTGDLVLSFNQLDAFGKLEPKRVLNTFKRLDRNPLKVKIIDSDVELVVAPGQLFINQGSDWKDAININEMIDSRGQVYRFNVNQITRGKHQIYDIIVEDNHSLIANGVRVHNMTYSIADVIAGRNLAGSDIQSGPISNYYRKGDYDNQSDHYTWGLNKRKKSKKRKIQKIEPKIDGLQAGAKLLSIEDLTDVLSEIVDDTSVLNLTTLKGVIQQSIDNIVNYLASFGASILNATMSAYDKSEILIMTADMTAAAVAMRKPFEETVVTANGKLLAQTQLKLFEFQIKRMSGILETYIGATDEDKSVFDVERNGQRTRKSNKGAKTSRSSNGRYETGGSNRQSSLGPQFGGSSRSGVSSTGRIGGGTNPAKATGSTTPGASTKNPGKSGPSYSKSQQKSISQSKNIGGLSGKPAGSTASRTGATSMGSNSQKTSGSSINSGNSTMGKA